MASYLTSAQTSPGISDSGTENLAATEAVIRIAVAGAYGRYGDLHMTSTSDGFAAIPSFRRFEWVASKERVNTVFSRRPTGCFFGKKKSGPADIKSMKSEEVLLPCKDFFPICSTAFPRADSLR